MERRKFIKNTTLGALGLTILPSFVFSKVNNQFHLGESNMHHRHGNLFASQFCKINHPKIESICRDVFFKNGSSATNLDAYRVQIKMKSGELVSAFFTPANRSQSISTKDAIFSFVKASTIILEKNDILIPFDTDYGVYGSSHPIQIKNVAIRVRLL